MISKLFKYAWKNTLRNPFLSISSIVILTLLMFFINILVVIHDVSFRIIASINERLTISLYLWEDYDKNSLEVIELQEEIQEIIPWIYMEYKTKEEVLEDIRETDPDLVNILERQNPLPETMTLSEIPLDKYELLDTAIKKRLYILTDSSEGTDSSYFSTYTKQFERIESLISVLKILQGALYIIIATFVLSIAIIIYSIIGNFIFYFRDEIYITRLVGGSKLFIYGPFSLQGVIYVVISFIVSTLIFFLLLSNVSILFGFSSLGEIFAGDIFMILLFEFIIFVCIGAMSGFISSRRYLQKK